MKKKITEHEERKREQHGKGVHAAPHSAKEICNARSGFFVRNTEVDVLVDEVATSGTVEELVVDKLIIDEQAIGDVIGVGDVPVNSVAISQRGVLNTEAAQGKDGPRCPVTEVCKLRE